MKLLKVLVLFIICFTFTIACAEQVDSKIRTIDDVDIQKLAQYSGTYVGDNSSVAAIIMELAGGDTYDELDLRNENVKVTYGIESNAKFTEEEMNDFWFKHQETLEENFLFNAIYLAMLVPNAKGFEFVLENYSFSITREEVMEELYKTFPELPKDSEMFDQDKVTRFMADHYEQILEKVKLGDFRKSIFSENPIQS